jgi:RNA polymerase sigma-70 factor (ECF subfamily)
MADQQSGREERGGRSSAQGQTTPLSLLERARASDGEAWRQLVELYRPLVLFWCHRGGLAGADADDLSQEVFAAAALGLSRFRHDRPGDTFRGWLRGITRHHLLLHFRKNAGQVRAEGGSDAWARLQEVADPLAGCEEEEQVEFGRVCRRVMEQVRGQFEERTWQAFLLTVLEGRSPTSLTEELGMSPAAIRQAKSRVLRRLKEEVGDLLDWTRQRPM